MTRTTWERTLAFILAVVWIAAEVAVIYGCN